VIPLRDELVACVRSGYRGDPAALNFLLRALPGDLSPTIVRGWRDAEIVRGSRTGAETLARSLANDLVDCKELRASLWPAGAA
jgi:hypothetical protein